MKYSTDRLLTTAEAARLLRVSQASIRRWSDSGLLRVHRVGRRRERRFSESDLMVFLNADAGVPRPETATAALNIGGISVRIPAHLATLYSTDAGRIRMTVPFFAEGLRSGQPCLLAANGAVLDRYIAALKDRDDVDFDRALHDGQFEVVHFRDGTAQGAIAEWEDRFGRILSGTAGVIRIVGEMAAERTTFHSEEEMLRYEEAFEVVYKRFPVVVICQYDVREFGGPALLRALKAHPDLFGLRLGAFLS